MTSQYGWKPPLDDWMGLFFRHYSVIDPRASLLRKLLLFKQGLWDRSNKQPFLCGEICCVSAEDFSCWAFPLCVEIFAFISKADKWHRNRTGCGQASQVLWFWKRLECSAVKRDLKKKKLGLRASLVMWVVMCGFRQDDNLKWSKMDTCVFQQITDAM